MNSPEMEVIWRETNLGIIMYVTCMSYWNDCANEDQNQ